MPRWWFPSKIADSKSHESIRSESVFTYQWLLDAKNCHSCELGKFHYGWIWLNQSHRIHGTGRYCTFTCFWLTVVLTGKCRWIYGTIHGSCRNLDTDVPVMFFPPAVAAGGSSISYPLQCIVSSTFAQYQYLRCFFLIFWQVLKKPFVSCFFFPIEKKPSVFNVGVFK